MADINELHEIVRRALADKVLTRAEQEEIMAAVLADGKVSTEEQNILNKILEDIQQGRIKAVD